jgi:hypothetical protein
MFVVFPSTRDFISWRIASCFYRIIVPITSIACNRLVLSLRGLVFSRSVVGGSEFGLSDRSTGPATSTPPQYLHTARVYFAPVHPSLGNTNGYSDRNNRNLGPVSSGTGTGTSTTATAASANEEWIFRHGNLPPFSPLSPHSPSESIGRRSSLETHGVLGLGNGIGRGDALRRSSSGGGGRRDNGVIVISAASAASGLSAGASQSHSRMRSLPEEDDLEFGPMPIVNIRRKANHDWVRNFMFFCFIVLRFRRHMMFISDKPSPSSVVTLRLPSLRNPLIISFAFAILNLNPRSIHTVVFTHVLIARSWLLHNYFNSIRLGVL